MIILIISKFIIRFIWKIKIDLKSYLQCFYFIYFKNKLYLIKMTLIEY